MEGHGKGGDDLKDAYATSNGDFERDKVQSYRWLARRLRS